MNKQLFKKTAQAAFRSEFGVEPKLKDITLLEASDDRTYILFCIGRHDYRFSSNRFTDGAIWVGAGTLEMVR